MTSASAATLARTGACRELRSLLQHQSEEAHQLSAALEALTVACKFGQMNVVLMLLTEFKKEAAPLLLPLHASIQNNHLDALQLLLLRGQWTAGEKENAIAMAHKTKRWNMVQALEDAAADYTFNTTTAAGLDRDLCEEKKSHCTRFGWWAVASSSSASAHHETVLRVCFKLHTSASAAISELSMLKVLTGDPAGEGRALEMICNPVSSELITYGLTGTLPSDPASHSSCWHGLALEKGQSDLQRHVCASKGGQGGVAAVCRQMVEIVQFIHSRGFVWLDCKLQNFVVFSNGRVKAVDVAGCLAAGAAVDRASVTFTVKYAAPELGTLPSVVEVNSVLDFWALGIALLQVMSGCKMLPALEEHFGLTSTDCYISAKYFACPDFCSRFSSFIDGFCAGNDAMVCVRRSSLQVDPVRRQSCSLARLKETPF